MKKMFEQPTFEVVRINKKDIIATSDLGYGGVVNDKEADAVDRFRDDF